MVFLLQGQSDPLMPGQRKANLKCQSPMNISRVRARCIYKAIGWFRIGFVMLPVLKKKCWVVQEQSSYQSWCWRQEHRLYQLVPRLHPSVHQELQPSHVDPGFLHWGCLQLHPEHRTTVNQSIRIRNKEGVLERWVTWLVLDSDGLGDAGAGFLTTRLVIMFLFLVKTRGATLAEVCLHLEADWSKSGWTVIITFFIIGDPLQKSTSGALGRKWNGSPLLVIGSGPSCCC